MTPPGHEDKLLKPIMDEKPFDYPVTNSGGWGQFSVGILIKSNNCCSMLCYVQLI